MSGFYYPESDLSLMDMFPSNSCQPSSSGIYAPSHIQPMAQRPVLEQRTSMPVYGYPQQQHPHEHQFAPSYPPQQYWAQPTSIPQQGGLAVPSYAPQMPTYSHYPGLSPENTLPSSHAIHNRASRSPSAASTAPFPHSDDGSVDFSRSISPSNSQDLRAYGFLNKNGTWACGYPGCTSRAVFTRGCDLRKHHKRHTKSFFCRHEGCPQATGGGFSSKKDLARHEAKHNPGVVCEWGGCERIFSRVDNMRDHVKRIHMKGPRPQPTKRTTTA
ncbi:hypothetical protein K490DRAFT_66854 [Saccharata proteae CBS 121410]|uniref:C2H2-type domain-containing protein n=1 Tax=Saccharata proteae CBS 121410 TaxID=1314787 RepID=A0A9P4HSY7_9PEZI|nr:hypothetical protein K490DRAFT_66854 [Saccharata proteae CBS 121410]